MKPEQFPTVDCDGLPSHLSSMPKICTYRGVNNLRAHVAHGGASGWRAVLDSNSARRALLSGSQTLTIFATMSDLKPHIENGNLRSSWERVSEHFRRAFQEEARAVTNAQTSDRPKVGHEAA